MNDVKFALSDKARYLERSGSEGTAYLDYQFNLNGQEYAVGATKGSDKPVLLVRVDEGWEQVRG